MGLLGYIFWLALPGAGSLVWILPLALVMTGGAAYVMMGIDVPMYIARWRYEVAKGTRFMSVS